MKISKKLKQKKFSYWKNMNFDNIFFKVIRKNPEKMPNIF